MAEAKISRDGRVYGWEYSLKRYPLANYNENIKGDYCAMIKNQSTIITPDIVGAQIMAERSEYRPETIADIISMAAKVERQFIAQGYRVNSGVVNSRARLQGTLATGTVAPVLNKKLGAIAIPTKDVKDILQDVQLFKGDFSEKVRKITNIFNYRTRTVVFHPHDIMAVTGEYLKLVSNDGIESGKYQITLQGDENSITLTEPVLFDNTDTLVTFALPDNFTDTNVKVTFKTYASTAKNVLVNPVTFTSDMAVDITSA